MFKLTEHWKVEASLRNICAACSATWEPLGDEKARTLPTGREQGLTLRCWFPRETLQVSPPWGGMRGGRCRGHMCFQ